MYELTNNIKQWEEKSKHQEILYIMKYTKEIHVHKMHKCGAHKMHKIHAPIAE